MRIVLEAAKRNPQIFLNQATEIKEIFIGKFPNVSCLIEKGQEKELLMSNVTNISHFIQFMLWSAKIV